MFEEGGDWAARFVRVCSMDVVFVKEATKLVCYNDSDAQYLANWL